VHVMFFCAGTYVQVMIVHCVIISRYLGIMIVCISKVNLCRGYGHLCQCIYLRGGYDRAFLITSHI